MTYSKRRALVAFNLSAEVMASLRAAHPTQAIDDSVSEYCLPGEIPTTVTALSTAVPRAGMGLACTCRSRVLFPLAPPPSQTLGSAKAPEDDPWTDETASPTESVQT